MPLPIRKALFSTLLPIVPILFFKIRVPRNPPLENPFSKQAQFREGILKIKAMWSGE
jgi:hypothetical protein